MWYPKPSVAKLVKVAISVVSRHITSVREPPFNINAHGGRTKRHMILSVCT